MIRRRLAGLGSAALLAIVVVPSCRAIVAGDSVDIAAEICGVLSDCYGDQDCAAIAAKLPSGDPVTTAFLQAFDPTACLGSCAPLKACLDTPPFCNDTLAADCSDETDCCNWSLGLADCVDGLCCLPDGVACGDGLAACCNDNCIDGSCGGYLCSETGEPCDDLAQCCSQLCIEGACSPIVCADFGQDCQIDEDCCSAEITMGEELSCKLGKCRREEGPQCSVSGQPCGDDADCCDALNLTCSDSGGVQLCGEADCPKVGDACLDGGICCPPYECREGECRFLGGCTADGQPCSGIVPCCNDGECTAGVCTGACADVACDHGVCEGGGPLQPSCNSDQAECIATVIAQHPQCGCVHWSAVCRCLAATQCASCPLAVNAWCASLADGG